MPQPQQTILIVEDTASEQKLMRDALEPLGYRIVEAIGEKSFHAAMEKLEDPPTLIVFDGFLKSSDNIDPKGNNGYGWKLAPIAREKYPDVPILFRSGEPDNKEIVACIETFKKEKPQIPCQALHKSEIQDKSHLRALAKVLKEKHGDSVVFRDTLYFPTGDIESAHNITTDYSAIAKQITDKGKAEAKYQEIDAEIKAGKAAIIRDEFKGTVVDILSGKNADKAATERETPVMEIIAKGTHGHYRPNDSKDVQLG